MAALEIPGNGDTGNHISEENILKTLDTLEDPLQKVRTHTEDVDPTIAGVSDKSVKVSVRC